MYRNLLSPTETETGLLLDLRYDSTNDAVCSSQRILEFNEDRCPMKLSQAIKILNPGTTRKALIEYASRNNLRGKEALKNVIDDACETACLAMSHIILNFGR